MPANIGSQTVTILYYAFAASGIVNKRFQGVREKGIYSGGYLSVVDDTHAQISTLVCEISDGTYQVRIETGTTVNLGVAQATPYIVLRWTYTGAVTDYMELLAVVTPTVNDLVVGKCTFDGGGHLNGFNYQDSSYPRTTPDTQDLFLKVESTAATELRVRIRAGRIQTSSATIDIADQKSNLFVPPAANSRIDLVYITNVGVVAIDSSGTPAANPSPPNYNGKLVLAEVTVSNGDTDIVASKIKDVRSFVSLSIPSGDETYVTTDGNGDLTLVGYSIDKVKISRYLPAEILPGWYVKYFADGSRTLPAEFTYGDPSGRLISLGQITQSLGNASTSVSILLSMKINNTSGGLKVVTQKLRHVDNDVLFFLNGVLFKSVVGYGLKNIDINWNLIVGENDLQIIYRDQGAIGGLILLGDIVNDTDVYFVGAV